MKIEIVENSESWFRDGRCLIAPGADGMRLLSHESLDAKMQINVVTDYGFNEVFSVDSDYIYLQERTGPPHRVDRSTSKVFEYQVNLSLPGAYSICTSNSGHIAVIAPQPNSLDFLFPDGHRLPGLWRGGEKSYFELPGNLVPFWEVGANSITSLRSEFVVSGWDLDRVDRYDFNGKYLGSLTNKESADFLNIESFHIVDSCIVDEHVLALKDDSDLFIYDQIQKELRRIDLEMFVPEIGFQRIEGLFSGGNKDLYTTLVMGNNFVLSRISF